MPVPLLCDEVWTLACLIPCQPGGTEWNLWPWVNPSAFHLPFWITFIASCGMHAWSLGGYVNNGGILLGDRAGAVMSLQPQLFCSGNCAYNFCLLFWSRCCHCLLETHAASVPSLNSIVPTPRAFCAMPSQQKSWHPAPLLPEGGMWERQLSTHWGQGLGTGCPAVSTTRPLGWDSFASGAPTFIFCVCHRVLFARTTEECSCWDFIPCFSHFQQHVLLMRYLYYRSPHRPCCTSESHCSGGVKTEAETVPST